MPKFPWQIISRLKCFARGNFHMFMTAAMRGRKSNKREFHLCHPISSSLWQAWKCFVHNWEPAHSLCSTWFGREEKVEVRKDQMQVVCERKQTNRLSLSAMQSWKNEELLFVLLLILWGTCSFITAMIIRNTNSQVDHLESLVHTSSDSCNPQPQT